MQKQIKLIALSILLIIFPIVFNFYVASRGVFHVDTFIHFDNAFRILEGDLPVKDYWIVHGLLIDYMQSFFFYFFGLSWFSYILHSSIFNAIICYFSFYLFLNYLNLKLIWSVLFAILISCLAYPVSGSPFLDLHSIYFSLFGTYFIIIAILKEKNKFWFFASLFFVIAFFCKQVPAFYIGFLSTLFCFYYSLITKNLKIFFIYVLGGISTVFLVLLLLIIQDINLESLLLQLFLFPSTIGGSRYTNYDLNLNNLFFNFKFLHFFLLSLISIIIINIVNVKNYLNSKDINVALILILFVVGSIFHQIYTKNQIFIFFLIPLITAFSFYFLANLKLKRKALIKIFLFSFCLIISIKYIDRYGFERKFHELSNVNLNNAIVFSKFDEKFKGLKWISPSFQNPEKEINILNEMKKNLLKNSEKNKMLLTEYNFFSLSLNKNYYGLSRTYDTISFPNKDSKYYENYKLFFKEKIIRNEIVEIFLLDSVKVDQLRLNHIVFNYIPEMCFDKTYINDFIVKLNVKDCEFLK